VGLQYRTIRAAATALLVAAAVGVGGMGGMTSALASDPGTITLTGTLLEGTVPLGGVHLLVAETGPDDAFAGVQAITAADGTFSADLFDWGTPETPATVSISATDDLQIVNDECSESWTVTIATGSPMTLTGGTPSNVTVTATTELIGEVCGTTGTPATGGSNGSAGSGGGRPDITPPPTDVVSASSPEADRMVPALGIGFVVGLIVAVALLLAPRPGTRRRD
jgi:hypothetical protein